MYGKKIFGMLILCVLVMSFATMTGSADDSNLTATASYEDVDVSIVRIDNLTETTARVYMQVVSIPDDVGNTVNATVLWREKGNDTWNNESGYIECAEEDTYYLEFVEGDLISGTHYEFVGAVYNESSGEDVILTDVGEFVTTNIDEREDATITDDQHYFMRHIEYDGKTNVSIGVDEFSNYSEGDVMHDALTIEEVEMKKSLFGTERTVTTVSVDDVNSSISVYFSINHEDEDDDFGSYGDLWFDDSMIYIKPQGEFLTSELDSEHIEYNDENKTFVINNASEVNEFVIYTKPSFSQWISLVFDGIFMIPAVPIASITKFGSR